MLAVLRPHEPNELHIVVAVMESHVTKHVAGGDPGLPNDMQIVGVVACGMCLHEVRSKKDAGEPVSNKDYARLTVGFTPKGLQVWCNRHEVNVLHVDFEGHKHPINTTARRDPKTS